MADEIKFKRTAERPSLEIWWRDAAKNLIDFSTGYTFSFKLGAVGSAAVFTKTTGITGAAGSGDDRTGVPNVVISFTAGELAALPAKLYTWELTATTGGLDRVFPPDSSGRFRLLDVIT